MVDWTKTRTVLLLYVFTVLGAVLGYASKAIYSRLLPQEAYGLLYSVLGFFAILTNVSGFGFLGSQQYYGIKFYTDDDERLGDVFWYTLLVEALSSLLFIAGIYVAIKPLAVSYFGDPSAVPVIAILSAYFLCRNLTTVLKRQFLVKEDYVRKEVANLLPFLFILLGTGFLYVYGAVSLVNVAWVWLASFAVVAIIYVFLSAKWFPDALPRMPSWDSDLFEEMVRYGIPAMLGAGGLTLLARIDIQVVTVLVGLSSAAVYEVSYSIASIQTLLSVPIVQFQGPRLQTAVERGNTVEAQHLLTTFTRSLLVLLGGFVVAAILNAEILARILFSAKYAEAAPYVQLLSFAFFFHGLSNSFLSVLGSYGLPNERMVVVYAAAAVNLVGSVLAGLYFNALGVAAVSTLVFVVLLVLSGVAVDRHTEMSTPWSYLVRGILLVGSWSAVAYWLSGVVNTVWESIPVTILIGLLYVAAVFIIRLVTVEMLWRFWEDLKAA
jgi:O-antigen/teichoic acid export membrane protein